LKQTEQLKEERKKREEQAKQIELLQLQINQQNKVVAERKAERKTSIDENKAIPPLIPESATRKIYIDLLLKEAGWDNLREGYELEYEVRGMPLSTNPSGIGYADYVLWGNNGLPLAVIEAKRTMADAHKGQHQAELYANCLEQMTGQARDFLHQRLRNLFVGRHVLSERGCMVSIQRGVATLDPSARYRKDVRNFKVNTAITNREYQLEALSVLVKLLVTEHKYTLKGKTGKRCW
jgi:type I restriction enzyme R subunit